MRVRPALASAVLALLGPGVAACGGVSPGQEASGTATRSGAPLSPSSSTAPPASSRTASPSLPASASRTPRPSTTASAATGVVIQGAEPSCLVLRTAHGELLLQGDLAATLKAGDRVTVRGHVINGVLTHCMQGTPFEVTHVSTPPP